ncbi:MAG: undecaprenyl-diphosphate phosphatase, partial [Candidatus Campbellbacteria bacterium]|nr:undecaprenyl-diphosphate phosphatase [Candidatus Campbellbacteria bacterium]
MLNVASALAIAFVFRGDIKKWFVDINSAVPILIGSIPIFVVGGFVAALSIQSPFVSIPVALLIGSFVLISAEIFAKEREVTKTQGAVGAGLFQVMALQSGMSRLGMSIAGGMFAGFSRKKAIEFAFLLAIPVLLVSSLVEFVFNGGSSHYFSPDTIFSSLIVFILISVLLRPSIEFINRVTLYPFAIYRIVLAGIIYFYFL